MVHVNLLARTYVIYHIIALCNIICTLIYVATIPELNLRTEPVQQQAEQLMNILVRLLHEYLGHYDWGRFGICRTSQRVAENTIGWDKTPARVALCNYDVNFANINNAH